MRACAGVSNCNPTGLTHQGPLFMEFPRQDWSGLLFHSPGDLPDSGIEPTSPEAPALANRFFTIDTEPSGKPICVCVCVCVCVFPQFKNFNSKVFQTAEELS